MPAYICEKCPLKQTVNVLREERLIVNNLMVSFKFHISEEHDRIKQLHLWWRINKCKARDSLKVWLGLKQQQVFLAAMTYKDL